MEPLLKIQNLKLSIKNQQKTSLVLKNLNFEIFQGECVGIVGESGCGKSLTAQAVACLSEHLMEGSVLFNGQDFMQLNKKEKRQIRRTKIGMIFQDPQACLNPTLSVGEQIREARDGLTKQNVLELLKKVQLHDSERIYSSYPHELSGGMCQRIMIAIVLARQPQLMIADEPTTALDSQTQTQILNLMKSIQETTDMGLLIISHDFNVIEAICNRVLVMYAGEIIESGTVKDILENPLHPYTKGLLKSRPKLGMKKGHVLSTIPGSPPKIGTPSKGCSFAPRCSVAIENCVNKNPHAIAMTENHHVACWQYSKE